MKSNSSSRILAIIGVVLIIFGGLLFMFRGEFEGIADNYESDYVLGGGDFADRSNANLCYMLADLGENASPIIIFGGVGLIVVSYLKKISANKEQRNQQQFYQNQQQFFNPNQQQYYNQNQQQFYDKPITYYDPFKQKNDINNNQISDDDIDNGNE